MLQVALAQVKTHARRFIAIGLAVMLAVGFLVATLLVGSSTQATLKASIGQSFNKADAVISSTDYTKPLSSANFEAVKKVSGVKESYAQLSAQIQVSAKEGSFNAQLQNTAPSAALQSGSLIKGNLPSAPNQVAIDQQSAERQQLNVGSTVTLSNAKGEQAQATVTALIKPSNDPKASGMAQMLASSQTVTPLATLPLSFDTIQLKLDSPLSQSSKTAIEKALQSTGLTEYTVLNSDEQTTAVMKQMTGGQDVLTIVLLAFAAIALIVAALVVANTFAVLVAQRTKELALLRCVGANRSQIRNSVLLEALVVGVISSLVGIALAIGGMAALVAVLSTVPGYEFATFEANWLAPTVGLIIGVLLTLVAALVPARAATAVAPLAAMRPAEDATLSNRSGRLRLVIGGLLIVIGGLALAAGAVSANLMIAVPGGAASFIGLLLCANLFVPRLVSGVGKLAAPAGVPGKLAALNAVRNPGRTTATAAALLIGVTLVSMMVTGAATARSAFDSTLEDRYPVDVLVNDGKYTPQQLNAVKNLPGVTQTVGVPKVGELAGNSAGTPVYGISTADANLLLSTPQNRVQPGQLLMPKGTKATSLPMLAKGSAAKELPIAQATVDYLPVMVNLETVSAPDGAEQQVWIKLAPGQDNGQLLELQGKIAKALGVQDYQVAGGALIKASFNQVIDILLMVVTGLLAIAILIALIGVANTLSLSVLERTRENALLRALGLTKRALRGMLALEAVLVAGVAALIGVVLGSLYGWLGAQSGLGSLTAVMPNIPWLQLLVIVLIAAVAGLAASVIPARRAARLSPVEGLATD
ncbi:ABC transporter permease [Psychromicrobium lacuslunae]|uniref:ABC transporter permease n=1 Tax=Psychromicrobium lacuslunae TaxID=1618207 RepID=A0A0D4BYT1_9MICC|nr:FtsX-like permease family protein [Psychromicrobium lacuslunae]AJT41261.1 ABC transporter permease [Psychromicrobium lacuslunae]